MRCRPIRPCGRWISRTILFSRDAIAGKGGYDSSDSYLTDLIVTIIRNIHIAATVYGNPKRIKKARRSSGIVYRSFCPATGVYIHNILIIISK